MISKKLNAEALEEQIAPVKYEIDGHEIKLSPQQSLKGSSQVAKKSRKRI